MKGWFASLAACAVLTEIAEALAPKGWREHLRRIAVLAAMAVLLAPLRDAAGWIGSPAALPDALRFGGEEADGRNAWFGAAELVFRYAEELGIDPASVTVAFREEDGWVLIDYKTDTIHDEAAFVERHREQLNWYAEALRRISGEPVKELWLYALKYGRAVPVAIRRPELAD